MSNNRKNNSRKGNLRVKTTRVNNTKNNIYKVNPKKTTKSTLRKKTTNRETQIYSIEQARKNRRLLENKRNLHSKKTLNKKSKNRNTAQYANFFAIVVFSFIIIYFSLFFIRYLNKDKVSYDTIQIGSITSPKTATGIIIRSEEVYKANKSGVVSFNYANNEKLKANTEVALIKNQENLTEVEQELDKINEQILSLQENRGELSWFSEDVDRINNKIQTIIDENIYYLSEGNISKLYELSSTVQKNIDTRNQIILSENTGSLSELATKRQMQETKISENSSVVKNQNSGVISYYIDGLEDTITFENILQLTKEQTKMNSTVEFKTANISVLEDDPIFKIITSNEWYIATYVDTTFVEGLEVGDYKTIYINLDGQEKQLEGEVYHIEKDKKESYLVLKFTKNILDYLHLRSLKFELEKVKEGFKIRNDSIAESNLLKIPTSFISEDGTIIKKTDNGNQVLNLDISYNQTESDFAYTNIQIGTINIGDTLINPLNQQETYEISEIFTAKGVYVINTGIPIFKTINLENSVTNQDYTILDIDLNTNIKIYDRIIKNIKNLEQS